MIPLVIAPVYNRHDLLDRMLDSIDAPVHRILIVDNGPEPYQCRAVDELATVWRPPFAGIGYGGAINFGISQTAGLPWWLWVSNDVAFHPGFLATVIERMQTKGPLVITGGFRWGAINEAAVDMVGLVDDWAFFPVYFDDNDYHYRCHLAGVEWIEEDDHGATHGDAAHGTSLTIRSDSNAESANHRSFTENRNAYIAKWGGLPGKERYTSPWNSGLPVWVVRPDPAGRAVRQWER